VLFIRFIIFFKIVCFECEISEIYVTDYQQFYEEMLKLHNDARRIHGADALSLNQNVNTHIYYLYLVQHKKCRKCYFSCL